jgi:hypothetical protein
VPAKRLPALDSSHEWRIGVKSTGKTSRRSAITNAVRDDGDADRMGRFRYPETHGCRISTDVAALFIVLTI